MIGETCIFCGYPVDSDAERHYRKTMPRGIHSRMSHGAQRDKDGRWYHIFVWQCILAEEIANGERSHLKRGDVETTVKAKCVGCGNTRDIGPNEIPKGELPMCDKCYSPMVAISAERK